MNHAVYRRLGLYGRIFYLVDMCFRFQMDTKTDRADQSAVGPSIDWIFYLKI